MNSNHFIRDLTKLLGTQHIFTTPYAHRSNGLVERANRTIQECLSHYVNEKHSNWDKYLPAVTFAINTTTQATTKYSPFFLVFGRHPRFPYDVQPQILKNLDKKFDDFRYLKYARDLAQQNIARAQESQKKIFDKNRQVVNFSPDSLVMVQFPHQTKGHAKKLSPKFRGPFTVIRQLDDLTYLVRKVDPKNSKTIKVHVDRMKSTQPRPHHLARGTVPPSDIILLDNVSEKSSEEQPTRTYPTYRTRAGRLVRKPKYV
jgi:hypothetical protein